MSDEEIDNIPDSGPWCDLKCPLCGSEAQRRHTNLQAVAHSGDERDAIEQWRPITVARPLDEWHEDDGDVLWWRFPIEEPPYVGSPLCSDWPGYHTHFTRICCPTGPDDAGRSRQ